MFASLNLLTLLSISLLGLALGDRTIRAVTTIILLGVLSTIFVQRVTDSFVPGIPLLIVDSLMWLAILIVCGNSRHRWCWLFLGVQTLIVANTAGFVLRLYPYQIGRFSTLWVYMVVTAVLTYGHSVLVCYALLDRYVGDPLAPPAGRS